MARHFPVTHQEKESADRFLYQGKEKKGVTSRVEKPGPPKKKDV